MTYLFFMNESQPNQTLVEQLSVLFKVHFLHGRYYLSRHGVLKAVLEGVSTESLQHLHRITPPFDFPNMMSIVAQTIEAMTASTSAAPVVRLTITDQVDLIEDGVTMDVPPGAVLLSGCIHDEAGTSILTRCLRLDATAAPEILHPT